MDITQRFRYLLTNDKISANFISLTYDYSSQLIQVRACSITQESSNLFSQHSHICTKQSVTANILINSIINYEADLLKAEGQIPVNYLIFRCLVTGSKY